MHHGQVLTASLLAHPCGVCESVSFRAVAGSSLLGSQNGKASWTILHFKLELIVFIYNLGRTGITEVAICTELHRVWMVTPGGRQNKAALFECPRSYGGSSNVAVFDICILMIAVFFLIASIQNAVHEVTRGLQSSFCGQRYRALHLEPQSGQFQPATRLQTLSSLVSLCVLSSLIPLVIRAVIFFSGCKCHAVKLELSTLSQVLPKE